MINRVVTEIGKLLSPFDITNYEVNRFQLQKLYDLMQKYALNPQKYFSYLVSYGLLQLHLDTHHSLHSPFNNKDETCILYGDLFYSIYYTYSVQNTFPLVNHNISRVLESMEIQALQEYYPTHDLLMTWINIIRQEEGLNELPI